MATIGNLLIRIDATTVGLRRSLRKAERSMNRTAKRMTNIGQRLSMTLSASIGVAGVAAVRTAAEFETLQNGLNILTGSAEEGAKAFERLKTFSAKTPFQLQDLVKANNILMGFGLNSDTAFDSLQQMGNIAAIMGSDFNRLAINFGQVSAAGVAMTRDIREFINNGVPMWELLSDATGKSTGELQEMATKQQITFELIQAAFDKATKEGGKFYKGLEKGSQTLQGVFSTMKDNISLALGTIGQSIAETLNLREVAIKVGEKLKELADRFAALSDGQKRFIVIMSLLAAALGPVLIALGSFITLLGVIPAALAATLGVAGLVITALSAIGVVIYNIASNMNIAEKTQRKYQKSLEDATNKGAAPYLKKLAKIEHQLERAKIQGEGFADIQKQLTTEFKDQIPVNEQVGSTYEALSEKIHQLKDAYIEMSRKKAISQVFDQIIADQVALESKSIDLVVQAKATGVTDFEELAVLIEDINNWSNKKLGEAMGINVWQAASFKKEVRRIKQEMEGADLALQNMQDKFGDELFSEPIEVEVETTTTKPTIVDGDEKTSLDIYKKFVAEQKKLNNLLKAKRIDIIEFDKRSFDLANKALDELVQNGDHASKEFQQISRFISISMDGASLIMPEIPLIEYEAGLETFEEITKKQLKKINERTRQENAELEANYRSTFERISDLFVQFGDTLFDANTPIGNAIGSIFVSLDQLRNIDFEEFFSRIKLGFQDVAADMMSITQAIGMAVSGVASAIAQSIGNQMAVLDQSYQAQLDNIEKLGLSEKAKNRMRLAAEKKYDRQMAEMKKRQARANKIAAISQAVSNGAVAVMKAFAELGPVGGAIASGLIAGVTAAQIGSIQSQPIPQFANGGIVSGRTLAEVGEYGSASRGNPEVIAPLNKLKSMLSDMGSNNITGEFRLRGDDLVAAVDQANRRTGRFSGRTQF